MKNRTRLVYSCEHGRICPRCSNPAANCVCAEERKTPLPGDGTVRVRRESKGRGGKTVTVVAGVPLEGQALKALAQELKQRCGTGGTVKEGTIEIQGDHTDSLVAELERRGFAVKRAGG